MTLVDRKTRFLCAGLIRSRSSTETREIIEALLKNMTVKSISLDNGSEFSEFRELEQNLNTEVYFAEPHKPWQRGANENTNDILRFFFPKGYNFHSLDNETLQNIVLSINLRPKKCLGWKSPFEAFLVLHLLDNLPGPAEAVEGARATSLFRELHQGSINKVLYYYIW